MLKFELTKQQNVKFLNWTSSKKEAYTGAIGGRYTFCFTPTGLGNIVKVIDGVDKSELDLTEYADW